jgi:hypothetical protein
MKDLASTKNRFSMPYLTQQPPKGFTTAHRHASHD